MDRPEHPQSRPNALQNLSIIRDFRDEDFLLVQTQLWRLYPQRQRVTFGQLRASNKWEQSKN
jgi:hypothetical protein